MEAILSLAHNSKGIKFIEFIPDFRENFDFSNNFLVVDGSRRKQTDITTQFDEQQSITQVSPPSKLLLDDLLVPDGMGILEQMFYCGKNQVKTQNSPQAILPSYLFFALQSKHSLPARVVQPIYNSFILQQSSSYERYLIIKRSAEYFNDATYEIAELSSKI